MRTRPEQLKQLPSNGPHRQRRDAGDAQALRPASGGDDDSVGALLAIVDANVDTVFVRNQLDDFSRRDKHGAGPTRAVDQRHDERRHADQPVRGDQQTAKRLWRHCRLSVTK